MTYSHLNRRLHLYLGLALLPWFFMYGISSVPFAHNQFFERRDAAKGLPLWTLRAERTLDVPVPENAAGLRAFGATLLEEIGIDGTSFGVYRQSPTRIDVYSYSFWKSTQLKYFVDQKKVTVEDRRFRWDHFLTGMHARGGFEQDGILQRFVERRRRPRFGGDDRVGRVRPLHVVGASRAASLGLAGDCRRSRVLSSLHHALVIGFSSFPADGPRLALGCMRLSTEPDRDDARSSTSCTRRSTPASPFSTPPTPTASTMPRRGHNERLIARAIATWAGDRSRIGVATKGGLTRPDGRWAADGRARHLIAACAASRRALGVERIHLYQLHAPDPRTPLATSVRALAALKRDGYVESIGLCNVTVGQIEEARTHHRDRRGPGRAERLEATRAF